MSLIDRITRTLLVAAIICFWAIDTKPQSEKRGSTVRGTAVYSDTGRPLRHARVRLYAKGSKWQTDAGTDLRGNFEFENVPAGKYLLVLGAPGLILPFSNVPQGESIVPRESYPEEGELTTEVTVNGTDSIECSMEERTTPST